MGTDNTTTNARNVTLDEVVSLWQSFAGNNNQSDYGRALNFAIHAVRETHKNIGGITTLEKTRLTTTNINVARNSWPFPADLQNVLFVGYQMGRYLIRLTRGYELNPYNRIDPCGNPVATTAAQTAQISGLIGYYGYSWYGTGPNQQPMYGIGGGSSIGEYVIDYKNDEITFDGQAQFDGPYPLLVIYLKSAITPGKTTVINEYARDMVIKEIDAMMAEYNKGESIGEKIRKRGVADKATANYKYNIFRQSVSNHDIVNMIRSRTTSTPNQ